MGNNPSRPPLPPSTSASKSVQPKMNRRPSLDLPDLIQPGLQYQARSQPLQIPRSTENSKVMEFRQPQPNAELERRVGHKRVQIKEVRVEHAAPSSSPPSFHPNAPPPSRIPTANSDALTNIIRSSIPMPLHFTDTETIPENVEPGPGRIEHKIYWRGGGTLVYLIYTSDAGTTQIMMDRESSSTFSTTVSFPAGTHHVRFLVDEQLRIADDLPSAVDDIGIFSNYITVVESHERTTSPVPSYSPPMIVNSQPPFEGDILANIGQLSLGRSFWNGSTDTDSHDSDSTDGASMPHYVPQWTTEIPLELLLSAEEEERYLAHAQQSEAQHQSGEARHIEEGFLPLPNIPPAQRLPRYLEKVILNQTQTVTQGTQDRHRDSRYTERQRDWDREKDIGSRTTVAGSLPVTTASGTDITSGANIREVDRMVPVMEALEEGYQSSSAAATLTLATTADDASILPVPSHAVLNHLATSAIKDGVLAVATTIRFRKKYGTIVYYKGA